MASNQIEIAMSQKLATILIATMLIAACGTTRLSTQDHIDIGTGQKSIARTDNTPLLPALLSFGILSMPSTTLFAVDGRVVQKDVFALDDQVAVAVGHHAFDVGCPSNHDSNSSMGNQSVDIEIQPSREYVISCRAKAGIDVKYRDLKNVQP
jgi:hypothetical protein